MIKLKLKPSMTRWGKKAFPRCRVHERALNIITIIVVIVVISIIVIICYGLMLLLSHLTHLLRFKHGYIKHCHQHRCHQYRCHQHPIQDNYYWNRFTWKFSRPLLFSSYRDIVSWHLWSRTAEHQLTCIAVVKELPWCEGKSTQLITKQNLVMTIQKHNLCRPTIIFIM